MKKIYFLFLIIFLTFLSSFSHTLENKILFKINNEIVTSIDLLKEIEYLKLFNKNIESFTDKEILIMAKNSIIKEKIKKLEILKYTDKLILDDDIYSNILKDILKNTNMENSEKFRSYLKESILNENFLKEKISIQIIWNDLISSKYSNKIIINDQEIRDELIKYTKTPLKSLFINELVFEIDEGETVNDKYNKIKKTIYEESFEKAAIKYSISESASSGGEIGWVNENVLEKKLREILIKTNINDLTQPIQVVGGFLILKVSDIREIKQKIDIEREVLKIKNLRINKQLEQFSNIYFNKIKKEITIDEL